MPTDPNNPYGIAAPPGFKFGTNPFGSRGDLYERTLGIETEERRRYETGMTGLDSAFTDLKGALSGGIRKDLMLSAAADATGLRARGMMDRMRSNLGARGIDPNSGAASGMLARLGMQMDNANISAMRDIDIADSQQRALNAGQLFSGALNVFQARNSPVPTAMADMGMNFAEMDLADRGIAAQKAMTKKAGKNALLGGLLQGGFGLLSGMAA